MAIPYQTAKFKSANRFKMAIWDPTAKFNSHQYFQLYGTSFCKLHEITQSAKLGDQADQKFKSLSSLINTCSMSTDNYVLHVCMGLLGCCEAEFNILLPLHRQWFCYVQVSVWPSWPSASGHVTFLSRRPTQPWQYQSWRYVSLCWYWPGICQFKLFYRGIGMKNVEWIVEISIK